MSATFEPSAQTAAPAFSQRFLVGLKESVFSLRWVAILLFLVTWQLISAASHTGLVPSPLRVWKVMWEAFSTGLFFKHLAISMVRILSGFVIAFLLGSTIGLLMGSRRFWDGFFQDIVVFALSLPGLVYALLSIVVFGLGLTAPIVAIVLAAFPFIAVNVREGVHSLDKEMLDMCRAYRISRWQVITKVILPSLVPFFLAAIRIGFTITWKVAVLTEVVGATSGIGYMIAISFDSFSVRGIIAWAFLFGAVMLVIEYALLVPAERYFARWRPQVKQVI
jgi:NitT/TauT family transport system permease protein